MRVLRRTRRATKVAITSTVLTAMAFLLVG